jgi:hypothetical protein
LSAHLPCLSQDLLDPPVAFRGMIDYSMGCGR